MNNSIAENVQPQNDNQENIIINNLPISMKIVQSIYNEITGKTETLTKLLRENHEISFDDIVQLNTKITQLLEQYNVVSRNCTVRVYYVNDCSEQFSSFERFKLFDQSSMSPCERIMLEYNFLILLPNTQQPQNYKIEVNLSSLVGERKKRDAELGNNHRFFNFFLSFTGSIEVEYIDYTVARNFVVAIDHWYEGVKKNKPSKYLKFFRKNSSDFNFYFRIMTIFSLVTVFCFYPVQAISPTPTFFTLFSGLVFAFGLIGVASIIAQRFGRSFENALDKYMTLSFVEINRGDEVAIQDFNTSNKKQFKNAMLSIVSAIFLNVVSALFIKYIGI